MISGRIHWAMYSISCCGMPELLMSFFRRAKLRNSLRFNMKLSRYKCGYVRMGVGRWQTSFRNFDYSNHRMLNARSIQRSNLQTKCRHPSRVSASKLLQGDQPALRSANMVSNWLSTISQFWHRATQNMMTTS